jgi:hypothetical protein
VHPLKSSFAIGLVAIAVLLPATAGFGYQSTAPPISADEQMRNPSGRRNGPPDSADEQMRARVEKEAAKKWNKERQAELKKDTDKLLELATQLKQQVDKSNENILSLDVVKKADEIEKLAHAVREKMRSVN